MPKRLLVATGIFLVILSLLALGPLLAICRDISRGGASGFGVVVGTPIENAFRFLMIVVLALLAYWLSSKLIRP